MARARVKFTFPPNLIKEPVIHNMSMKYNIVTNIRRANVTKDKGWVVLELEGSQDSIDNAVASVTALGVRVDPVEGDVVEG
ncbi:MAG TPA: NIL domain-containing protein [Chloroflexota bacterium]|nr:NIL domain-containing protein [Chloroflexota bacterium]